MSSVEAAEELKKRRKSQRPMLEVTRLKAERSRSAAVMKAQTAQHKAVACSGHVHVRVFEAQIHRLTHTRDRPGRKGIGGP